MWLSNHHKNTELAASIGAIAFCTYVRAEIDGYKIYNKCIWDLRMELHVEDV